MKTAKKSDPEATDLPIRYQDVLDAAARIEDGVERTPAEYSKVLSDTTTADIYLKFEIFQHTASFKERGGLNRLLKLSDEERARGVIASSAGNHAQSVAYHAGRLGIPATIVMPKGTPFSKVKRTEDLGAEVVLAGSNFAAAAARAHEIEQQRNLTVIHTFDDPDIMAGHGTVAIEFLDRFADLEVLVVPVGGGGLISGIAVVTHELDLELLERCHEREDDHHGLDRLPQDVGLDDARVAGGRPNGRRQERCGEDADDQYKHGGDDVRQEPNDLLEQLGCHG